jgi:xanthine dehydrogenase accessory factor
MLLRSDFSTLGTLGGGCVEAEVRKRAFDLLNTSRSGLLNFVLDHDYGWDDGLICGGSMDVGVMPIGSDTDLSPFQSAVEAMQRRQPASFPVIVTHEGRRLVYRVNMEVPPTLLIAGAGHVGQALAKLAVDLDFHVVVIDDRGDLASVDRFGSAVELLVGDIATTLREYPIDAGSYVVIVTRGHQHDEQALDAVIRRDARYIGLIGSKRKAKLILDGMRDAGVDPSRIDRVHTPIGLSIGAILVPEIAVSIAAELVRVRRQESQKLVEGPTDC